MDEIDDYYVAHIDKDLRDLVPSFIENRKQDVDQMVAALQSWDFETLRKIGHQIKGSGGGYGLDMITEYGRNIQAAAEAQDYAASESWIYGLLDYLNNVQVVYE